RAANTPAERQMGSSLTGDSSSNPTFQVVDLGIVAGDGHEAINANGEIVGSCVLDNGTEAGYIWRHGKTTILPTIHGALRTLPYSMNTRQEIVGQVILDSESRKCRALKWDASGRVALMVPEAEAASAAGKAINESGMIAACAGDIWYRH